MLLTNDWSRIIEGTHAVFCGLFALVAIRMKIQDNHRNYLIYMSVSMGSQLMNSILYMFNYFIQTHDYTNINHCRDDFPCGLLLLERPFMYVNVFWTIMPIYTIYKALKSKDS